MSGPRPARRPYAPLPKAASWRERLYVRYVRMPNHPMKLRLERWLRRAFALRRVLAQSAAGVRFRLLEDDFVQHQILRCGVYEPRSIALVRQLLAPGDVMVDVGGHVGLYALHAAAAVGATGRVITVEPNPWTYEYLLENVALNDAGNVTAVLGAVGDEPGAATLTTIADGNWGQTRVVPAAAAGAAFTVAVVPLGLLLRGLGVPRVDVLKIDVEGFEERVLRSIDLSSSLRPRHIVFEYLPELAAAHSERPDTIIAHLTAAGYELRDVTGAPYRVGEPLPEDNLWALDRTRRDGALAPGPASAAVVIP